jgi:hypothetical protein
MDAGRGAGFHGAVISGCHAAIAKAQQRSIQRPLCGSPFPLSHFRMFRFRGRRGTSSYRQERVLRAPLNGVQPSVK